jgi:serine protease Do
VKFEVQRKGKPVKLDITLDSPSDVLDKMNRNQQMSGRTSRRKDPFPMILQTDIPVPPESMGSPLLDLEGRAVGILISRTDRVTTYALPKDVVLKVLEGVEKE